MSPVAGVIIATDITTPKCASNWHCLDVTKDDMAKAAASGASHQV
jgi:hypothetical protein